MKKDPLKVILGPRVTEKAAYAAEVQNAYVFEVSATTNKVEIARAVKELYKVTPAKINIVKLPAKKVFVKGKKGKTARMKKAYVYLKKGEKIELA